MKNTAPRYNHWSKFQDRKSNTVESQRMEELKTNFRTKLGILNKNKVLYIKKNSTKNSEKTQWEKRNKKKRKKKKKGSIGAKMFASFTYLLLFAMSFNWQHTIVSWLAFLLTPSKLAHQNNKKTFSFYFLPQIEWFIDSECIIRHQT